MSPLALNCLIQMGKWRVTIIIIITIIITATTTTAAAIATAAAVAAIATSTITQWVERLKWMKLSEKLVGL